MRFFLFILSIIFIACSEEVKQMNDLVAKQEKPLTKEVKNALDQAMESYFQITEQANMASVARNGLSMTKSLFLSREECKDLKFTEFPLYVFNVEKFMENPCEEQVSDCVGTDKDQKLFVGRRDGHLVMSTSIKRVDGVWRKSELGTMREEDFIRNYSNVPSLIAKADNNKFYFLVYYSHLFVVYDLDGVTYFSTTGNVGGLTKARFAEMVLAQYKMNH